MLVRQNQPNYNGHCKPDCKKCGRRLWDNWTTHLSKKKHDKGNTPGDIRLRLR